MSSRSTATMLGFIAALIAAATFAYMAGQGDTAELERRLSFSEQDNEELTERLGELEAPQVTSVPDQLAVQQPQPADSPPTPQRSAAFELEMTPGQTVELPGTRVAVGVAAIGAEGGSRTATVTISKDSVEETATLASGADSEMAGAYVRVKDIQPTRITLYVRI